MFAVFEDGSRQYQVSPGTRVKLDHREVDKGQRLEFGRVLLFGDGDDVRIGQPTVEGMRVVGTVVDKPSTKYVIQKLRRRKNSRRRTGHRQKYVLVEVEHILLPGQDAPPPEEKKAEQPPEPKMEEKPVEESAPQESATNDATGESQTEAASSETSETSEEK